MNDFCRIADDVKLGKGVVIKAFVNEKALSGAGSVVTHSVPPRETWAGNPARRLRA